MGANIAGIYGAQIFRADDKPRYRRAFSVNIGVLTFGLILATVRYLDDRVLRRKGRRQSTLGATPSPEGEEETKEMEVEDQKGSTLLARSEVRHRGIVEVAK
jgi:hypothetical protein